MKKKKKVKAAILIIGNEILSGRTQDKNIAFICNWLNINCGITVPEVRIIPDVEKIIIKNIRFLSKQFNYVFTTGGIEAYEILENYYGKEKFNDGRKKMAKMPVKAELIYNPSSAAPGFITKNVLSLPGVPSILNSMIENCKKYLVKGLKVHSKTINLFTVESIISKQLGVIQKKYKKNVDIGSYPFFRLGKIGVSIVSRSTSKKILMNVHKDIIKIIKYKKIKILNI